MKTYLFYNENFATEIITDGIGDQKEFMITEWPPRPVKGLQPVFPEWGVKLINESVFVDFAKENSFILAYFENGLENFAYEPIPIPVVNPNMLLGTDSFDQLNWAYNGSPAYYEFKDEGDGKKSFTCVNVSGYLTYKTVTLLDVGQEYTFSILVKNSSLNSNAVCKIVGSQFQTYYNIISLKIGGVETNFGAYNNITLPPSLEEWTVVEVAFTPKNGTPNFSTQIELVNSEVLNKTIWLMDPKLEIGPMATR